jgi:hypothetical protein
VLVSIDGLDSQAQGAWSEGTVLLQYNVSNLAKRHTSSAHRLQNSLVTLAVVKLRLFLLEQTESKFSCSWK